MVKVPGCKPGVGLPFEVRVLGSPPNNIYKVVVNKKTKENKMQEQKRIVEIGGIKMEVDLRDCKLDRDWETLLLVYSQVP